jgi:hypothetical protein
LDRRGRCSWRDRLSSAGGADSAPDGFGFEVSMSRVVAAFSAVEDLAGYIHEVLCDKDALDPAQAPLFRTPLRRSGRVCGLVFHVEGPRLLRTSAVWSSDDARIIFYDSSGLRFREVELSESPSAERGARNAE